MERPTIGNKCDAKAIAKTGERRSDIKSKNNLKIEIVECNAKRPTKTARDGNTIIYIHICIDATENVAARNNHTKSTKHT